jgi:hypothetical protein
MFPCSACFGRAVTVLLGELPLASKSTSTLPAAAAATSARRPHSTVASIRKGHHRRVLRETLASKGAIPLKKSTLRKGPSAAAVRDLRARERNRATLGIEAPVASADPAAAGNPGHYGVACSGGGGGQTKAQQQYAVQFLKDPLKLASAVLGQLRLGDVQGALGLVRASDRQKVENNVVSWNHVMDYAMSVQDVKGALAVYNEVS